MIHGLCWFLEDLLLFLGLGVGWGRTWYYLLCSVGGWVILGLRLNEDTEYVGSSPVSGAYTRDGRLEIVFV